MKLKNAIIYDISMPITVDMPVYKGKEVKRPKLSVDCDFTNASVYESRLEMNLHTGTHLDRTLHMIPDGNTVETLELKDVITVSRVINLTEVENCITAEHLKDKGIKEGEFLLLKTKNSYEPILENNYIYVDRTGAEYLASQKVKGVGIDALGIERNQAGHETHLQLMEVGIHILEGLRLKDIEEGEYLLFAAPLNIPGAEAAPVRAILIKET